MTQTITQEEANKFFDEVHKAGKMEVFNAPAYLMNELGVPKKEAWLLFQNWAERFGY